MSSMLAFPAGLFFEMIAKHLHFTGAEKNEADSDAIWGAFRHDSWSDR